MCLGEISVSEETEFRGYFHWTTDSPILLVRYPPCGETAVLHLFCSLFTPLVTRQYVAEFHSPVLFCWKPVHFALVNKSVALILMCTLEMIKLHPLRHFYDGLNKNLVHSIDCSALLMLVQNIVISNVVHPNIKTSNNKYRVKQKMIHTFRKIFFPELTKN